MAAFSAEDVYKAGVDTERRPHSARQLKETRRALLQKPVPLPRDKMAGLQVLGCSTVMLLLLLLLPASTQQFFHRESQEQEQPLDRDTEDALSVLRNVKRRVIGTSECRNWNEPCVPWANDPRNACCDQDALLCRCNLWMQNCRCVARAWGK